MQLWQLFYTFFQIGLFSIGGGYAIIPLIQNQVVTSNPWITQRMFTDIITISQMTPGPLAVNTSTFVGLQIAGLPGAILATIGCVFSGVFISVLLYRFFSRHEGSSWVLEILSALKSASVGLIMSAAASILLLAFHFPASLADGFYPDLTAVVLFGISLFVLRKFKKNPILIMVLTGVFYVLAA